jgi:hypothetical protein
VPLEPDEDSGLTRLFAVAGENDCISLAVNVRDDYVPELPKGSSNSWQIWFSPPKVKFIISQYCWNDTFQEIILIHTNNSYYDFEALRGEVDGFMEFDTLRLGFKRECSDRTKMMEFIKNKVQEEVEQREASLSAGNTSDLTQTSRKVIEIVDRIKLGEIWINGKRKYPTEYAGRFQTGE